MQQLSQFLMEMLKSTSFGWLKELNGEHIINRRVQISSFAFMKLENHFILKNSNFYIAKIYQVNLLGMKGFFGLLEIDQCLWVAGAKTGGIAHHGFAGLFWKKRSDVESLDFIQKMG